MRIDSPCPCGTGDLFDDCCLPLHAGAEEAQTAEKLMRSRYSAYAVGDMEYLWRTWHPRTRPDSVGDAGLVWTRLEIIDCVAGGPGDETGEVEFRAHYLQGQRRALARGGTTPPKARGRAAELGSGFLHERSRFAVRARRWFYVDGDLFS